MIIPFTPCWFRVGVYSVRSFSVWVSIKPSREGGVHSTAASGGHTLGQTLGVGPVQRADFTLNTQ